MASPASTAFRFPHNVQAVLQQIRQGLGIQSEQQQLGDAVALLDDRDRWVEDNLSAIDGRVSTLSGIPSGALLDWAAPTPPDGFLLCDGTAVSRVEYSVLFTAIGTTWGVGDGTTTFNLPDFRGRVTIGAGAGPSLTPRTVGQKGGEERHTQTVAEMPAHTHTYDAPTATIVAYQTGTNIAAVPNVISGVATGSRGSGTPANVMQPFAVVLKIIKT